MYYELKKSEILFKGKVFNLKVDEIEYASGNKGVREVAVHPGGAVVVPLLNNGRLLLIKQFRYPLQRDLIEFPAGKLFFGEDPLECAKRELTEETGYSAHKISKLGEIFTTPGFCDEILHLYLAEDLTEGNHNREEGELGMEIFEVTPDEIHSMIASGKILDAKTICAFYYFVNSSRSTL